jgi:hypothetical protein
MTRREWIGAAGAAALAEGAAPGYRLYWGDLHNHNAVGYAQGSIERTYDIARTHLDFIAFTPHAQWHDMPEMPGNAHRRWIDGFKVTLDQWSKVQKLAAENNNSGKFVSLLAYEWHSSHFGDYCLYYPDDNRALEYFDDVRKLQAYAKAAKAIVIPHHLAYKQGWRGANWEFLDPSVSPVIEVFSEHGLSERDRMPHDYITHSNGPRWTRNTVQAALRRGFRVGFIASSDDHLGFPGAYGEGIAGIYATELSRAGIFDALMNRRTIAVSGDRIGLVARLNGRWMGSVLPYAAERKIEVEVDAPDEIDRIDVIKNGRTIYRHFPEDHMDPPGRWPGEALCRLEFGWGPWGALAMDRTCDWEVEARIHHGKILAVTPCFQSGPYDEERRNRVVSHTESGCRFQLYTSRKQAYRERAANSVILRVGGGPKSTLEVSLKRPAAMTVRKTLAELMEHNEVEFTGRFTSESFVVHRLVTPDLARAKFTFADRGRRDGADWYYARATLVNGHQAWCSPIYVSAEDK